MSAAPAPAREPKEAIVLRLANTILKDVDIPPPAAWDAAVIAYTFFSAPAPGLEEAVEAARRIIDWVELTGEGPSDAWPTTCGDAIAIARALVLLTRGDGRELGAATRLDDEPTAPITNCN